MVSPVKTNTRVSNKNETYASKHELSNSSHGKRRNNNSRRRKKRRTEDFSSSEDDSSSSSSDSSSDNDSENDEDTLENRTSEHMAQVPKSISSNVQLREVIEEEEFQPELEITKIFKIDNTLAKNLKLLNSQNSKKVDIGLSVDDVRDRETFLNEFILDNILTDIPENKASREKLMEKLSELSKDDTDTRLVKSKNIKKGSSVDSKMEKTNEAKNKLLDEFISLMMKNYDNDLNTFRKASDLTSFSLSILATTLKEGGTIFDYESLQAILN